MNVNLGCGKNKIEGFDENFDRVDFGFNKVCDFEKDRLPLKDDSVDYIWCNHVLEHLWDVKNILNECWRVLKKNGLFEIKVPHGLWTGASKPVHHQCITECWFNWLQREEREWYGYEAWKILEMTTKNGDRGPYEIRVLLTPKK